MAKVISKIRRPKRSKKIKRSKEDARKHNTMLEHPKD